MRERGAKRKEKRCRSFWTRAKNALDDGENDDKTREKEWRWSWRKRTDPLAFAAADDEPTMPPFLYKKMYKNLCLKIYMKIQESSSSIFRHRNKIIDSIEDRKMWTDCDKMTSKITTNDDLIKMSIYSCTTHACEKPLHEPEQQLANMTIWKSPPGGWILIIEFTRLLVEQTENEDVPPERWSPQQLNCTECLAKTEKKRKSGKGGARAARSAAHMYATRQDYKKNRIEPSTAPKWTPAVKL